MSAEWSVWKRTHDTTRHTYQATWQELRVQYTRQLARDEFVLQILIIPPDWMQRVTLCKTIYAYSGIKTADVVEDEVERWWSERVAARLIGNAPRWDPRTYWGQALDE